MRCRCDTSHWRQAALDAELVFGVDRSERLASHSFVDEYSAAIARNVAKNYNERLSVG